MTTDPEEASELRHALHETLQSAGWQRVIHPALVKRLALARMRLEDGRGMSLDQVCAVQAEIRLLREMVEKPREAFGER